MREILFRGKSKSDGEWLYGAYYKQEEYYGDPCEYHYIICSKDELEDNMMLFESVIPETLGQFTGLTDKNGKKIFEGDIVESEFTKKPYLVCFCEYTYTNEYGEEESACGWYNEEKGGYVTAFGCPDAWATVIGNIHDNPELLKGGGE